MVVFQNQKFGRGYNTHFCKNGQCLKIAHRCQNQKSFVSCISVATKIWVMLSEMEMQQLWNLVSKSYHAWSSCLLLFLFLMLSDFLSSREHLSENTRPFAASFKGKATIFSYSCICPKDGCNQVVDFTDIIVNEVLDNIHKEALTKRTSMRQLNLLGQKRWHVMPWLNLL